MSQRRVQSAAPLGNRRRSAMGDYIPEPGQRPLSSYGQPTPSGFDYRPSTKGTLPASPSYSLYGRPYSLTKVATPGPPEYCTRKDAVWRHRTFTMTRKGTTRPYDIRENAHITSGPGPGVYHRVYGDTGSVTKRSMSARHREGLHVGYPNSLIQPVDTLGFSTPGPSLWREPERGAEKSFGLALKPAEMDEEGPGPAAYCIASPMSPGKSIGVKFVTDYDPHYPAPNQYTIPDAAGKGPAKTFGIKNDITTDQHFPSPDTYELKQPYSRSHTFNYRPFPTPGENGPAPAEYSLTDSNLPKPPHYTCRDKCRPVFPDILLYPEFCPLETPGAGEYEYDREFADNSAPKYSHGLPLPTKPNSNPGPNHYQVQHQPTQARPPSYSIGHRLPAQAREADSPSPAKYTSRPRPASAVTITPRRTRATESAGPAANCYQVPSTLTRRGHFPGHMASLKSRRSTVCYSGFPSSHLSRLASLAT